MEGRRRRRRRRRGKRRRRRGVAWKGRSLRRRRGCMETQGMATLSYTISPSLCCVRCVYVCECERGRCLRLEMK